MTLSAWGVTRTGHSLCAGAGSGCCQIMTFSMRRNRAQMHQLWPRSITWHVSWIVSNGMRERATHHTRVYRCPLEGTREGQEAMCDD